MAEGVVLVLGDMLHEGLPGLPGDLPVVMIEDFGLGTRVRHHQQKIVLFLAAMRHFRDRLLASGRTVRYFELPESAGTSFVDRLRSVARNGPILTYEVNDRAFRAELAAFDLREIPTPMFLTSAEDWNGYGRGHRRRLMAEFYKWQRRRLNVMVDALGEPEGGRWSFDEENRKPLPRGIALPESPAVAADSITREVIRLVEACFSDHPGRATDFAYPVTPAQARAWLAQFLAHRFARFGDYEDALSDRHRTLFHSVLTPMLNTGLLNPREVLDAALATPGVPINAREGFVRQLIGWREFIRGMDRDFGENGVDSGGSGPFGHHRRLGPEWWNGTTGLAPLDLAIRRARDHGWCHHIERLMVLGAAMLMCEVLPEDVFRWFMEMFIDSADWVMLPNVLGMSQFSDGGLFATKPYLSGSAYLLRMGDTPRGDWCDVWDGLYWRFIGNHREFFLANPRTAQMARGYERLDPIRRDRICALAEDFIRSVTRDPA